MQTFYLKREYGGAVETLSDFQAVDYLAAVKLAGTFKTMWNIPESEINHYWITDKRHE